jgi:histidinol phosphatase-like enzyme (inositol monophosphatase family)
VTAAAVDPSLVDAAVDLAREAGDLTLRWFRSVELAVDTKADGTPVTEADRAAERLVRERLAAQFPDDAVLGEEEGDQPGTSGRYWIVDPIDGTKSFTHGVPLYCTLLGVADEHGPAVGVIHLPALGETVWAGRGRGCFLNGRPTRVGDHATVRGAYVMSSGVDGWPGDTLAALVAAGAVVRTWGDGYGYALVATGRVEAMIDPVVAPWDLAPMPVILAEAGGTFTDLGGEARIDGGSGVASNGRLHEELLGLLARPRNLRGT